MELTVNGRAAFAATGGRPFDPAAPAAVFIHGAAMDHTVWYLQDRFVAHHGRSFAAVDLPGHGRSEGPPLPTIAEMADWVIAFLDAAGVEKAALAGHSMGAFTALDAAARHPGRVESVTLLGVAAAMPVHPDLLAAAKADDHLAFDLINAWSHARPSHIGLHPVPGLWMMGGVLRLMERSAPGVMYNDLKACADYDGATEAAARLACPLHLVLGAEDMMTPPRNAAPLAESAVEADTTVIPGCGHMLMVEKPHDTIAALARVL
jgi:pimeloyl-ACP methyl ester carboxylesterase